MAIDCLGIKPPQTYLFLHSIDYLLVLLLRRGDSIVNTMLSQSGRPRVGSSQSRDVRSMRSSHEWQVFDNSHIHHPDALPSTAAVAVSTPTVSRRSEEEEEEENGSEETPRLLDQWQTPDGGSDSSALWHSCELLIYWCLCLCCPSVHWSVLTAPVSYYSWRINSETFPNACPTKRDVEN